MAGRFQACHLNGTMDNLMPIRLSVSRVTLCLLSSRHFLYTPLHVHTYTHKEVAKHAGHHNISENVQLSRLGTKKMQLLRYTNNTQNAQKR